MYYVYILKNKLDNKVYIGYTNNLVKRISEHNSGKSIYTKRSNVWSLVYFEGYTSRYDASYREQQLKAYGKTYSNLKRRIWRSLQWLKGAGQKSRTCGMSYCFNFDD